MMLVLRKMTIIGILHGGYIICKLKKKKKEANVLRRSESKSKGPFGNFSPECGNENVLRMVS